MTTKITKPTKALASSSKPKASRKRQTDAATLRVDVLHILRERIANSELSPGAKLNEYELAKEFNVPRTRIREAFTALEQRGLIERIPNRGAIVARLEQQQVFDIYDMREVLEGLCARLACQNADPASWQDLLDQFSGPVEEAVKRGDFEAYTEAYGLFRKRCIEAANNPVLAQALDNIYEKTQFLIHRIVILPGRGEIGVREHRDVLKAMRAGDAEAAERLRRANIRNAKAFLARYIKYVL
jgi:DNA-binding GntR family transcriptional regulator